MNPKSVEIKLHYSTVPFVGTKAECTFEIPENVPVVQPNQILFGKLNPEKGWGIRLVRVDTKENKGTFRLRLKILSMYAEKEYLPYEGAELAKPVKDATDNWSLDVAKPLSPGYYALAAANGATSPGLFNRLTVEASIFQVAATPAPTAPVSNP